MIARIRKSLDEKERGFTLIELLVVMIIIGILAAIAIPVFLSQREKARDTSTKADVSTIGKEIATYYVEPGTTPALTLTAGTGNIVLKSGTVTIATIKTSVGTVLGTPAQTNIDNSLTWCVGLTNPDGKQDSYKYSAAAGLESGVCA